MNKNNSQSIHNVRWRRVIRLILKDNPGTVLDIGCSSGYISTFLVKRGISVFGLDIEQQKISLSKREGIIVTVSDISRGLPYKDNFFDVVLAGEIIEHIIDTDYFLEEAYRVLKDNGTLLITTPNLVNLENRLRILIGRYPIFVDYTSRGDNHVRAYTERALVKQLKEKGFKIEVKTGSFAPLISYSKMKSINSLFMPILATAGYLFPRLAIHVIVKARKISPQNMQ